MRLHTSAYVSIRQHTSGQSGGICLYFCTSKRVSNCTFVLLTAREAPFEAPVRDRRRHFARVLSVVLVRQLEERERERERESERER
jgi:hypothetical protein